MTALALVNRLVEDDLDEPAHNLERFAGAIGAENAQQDKRILSQFKQSVNSYLKWKFGTWRDVKVDMDRVRAATTIDDVRKVLKRYKPEMFHRFVRDGYLGHLNRNDARATILQKLQHEV